MVAHWGLPMSVGTNELFFRFVCKMVMAWAVCAGKGFVKASAYDSCVSLVYGQVFAEVCPCTLQLGRYIYIYM